MQVYWQASNHPSAAVYYSQPHSPPSEPPRSPLPRRSKLALTLRAGRGQGNVAVVVNYEAAWRDPMHDLLLSMQWDVVICDESHRIKAPGGRASKFVGTLAKRATRRLALTGTPIENRLGELWSIMGFSNPGLLGSITGMLGGGEGGNMADQGMPGQAGAGSRTTAPTTPMPDATQV